MASDIIEEGSEIQGVFAHNESDIKSIKGKKIETILMSDDKRGIEIKLEGECFIRIDGFDYEKGSGNDSGLIFVFRGEKLCWFVGDATPYQFSATHPSKVLAARNNWP